MRRIARLLAVVLLLASCAFAQSRRVPAMSPHRTSTNTFTLIQSPTNFYCTGSTTCDVTVGSTGAGHVLAITAGSDNGNYITAASGAGTWTIENTNNVGCARGSGGTYTSCAYILASSAGVTTITLTLTNTSSMRGVFWEYSFTGGSASRDTSNSAANTPSLGVLTGATATLTGASDAVIEWEQGNNTTAVSGGYTHLQFVSDAGWADLLNTSSGAAPSWTVSTANGGKQAVLAFK